MAKFYACGLDAFEILHLKEYENTIVDSVNQLFDKNVYATGLQKHKEDYTEDYIKGIRLDLIEKFTEELKEQV